LRRDPAGGAGRQWECQRDADAGVARTAREQALLEHGLRCGQSLGLNRFSPALSSQEPVSGRPSAELAGMDAEFENNASKPQARSRCATRRRDAALPVRSARGHSVPRRPVVSRPAAAKDDRIVGPTSIGLTASGECDRVNRIPRASNLTRKPFAAIASSCPQYRWPEHRLRAA